MSGPLTADRLKGRTVVVVAAPGADQDTRPPDGRATSSGPARQ